MTLPRRLFVTGTGTDVGKTVVAALLMAGRGGRYWKPVQSGAEQGLDSGRVRAWAGPEGFDILAESHVLRAPLSPHAAAAREGVRIQVAQCPLPADDGRPLVVEGAGGVLVPLNGREMMVDLIVRLGLPVLVVAASALGTINHTLLTLEALRSRGVDIAAVVMNGEPNPGNMDAVRRYGEVAVAALPPLPRLERPVLSAAWKALRFR